MRPPTEMAGFISRHSGVRILTSDSASQPTDADRTSLSPAVGFIPRLNSWAFASKLCSRRTARSKSRRHVRLQDGSDGYNRILYSVKTVVHERVSTMSAVYPAEFSEQVELVEEAVWTERQRLAGKLGALIEVRECAAGFIITQTPPAPGFVCVSLPLWGEAVDQERCRQPRRVSLSAGVWCDPRQSVACYQPRLSRSYPQAV